MSIYQNARRDINGVSVLCGVSDLDGSVMPLQIDPVTGRLLIEIVGATNASPVLSHGWAVKDANGTATLLGVTDNATGLLIPEIYNGNSRLWVEL